ncbi:MAG: Ni/Fe hydrogenase subunit gamma [Nitrospira sp. SG-bin2]|uniref:FAD/NAD(P)-binding protein n=1 Tax=Nitrospira cf. moscoviensis SBR1015 TaxID=96242 RepID=UPI000A0ADF86|nr:FAD/NAD(P)-binding protein [Nitrospira cf. moscoviensis SBR1015]OQW35328.1 MAG: Ni/Fe hydrogenase subunit gamma [Nitrospira sp. SG-bin2]
MAQTVSNPYLIQPATIVEKIREADDIDTYRLQFVDEQVRRSYRFSAGQFNMVYLFGVGEVAISIVSDPDRPDSLDHTIRAVGRVTKAIAGLKIGDVLGIRGPFGQGWPLADIRGKDIVVVTGGLGCAPVVGAIEYIFRRRRDFGAVRILHGVKTPHDLLYRERFETWRQHPDTKVYLTSDRADKNWQYHVGVVTGLFHEVRIDPARTAVLMCGPEIMMRLGAPILIDRGIPATSIYVSLERHMECGIGLCGHCQMGPYFLCKDGPVMRYDLVAQWLGSEGV